MVKKQNNRRIVLYDPDRGMIKLSKTEFMRRWRYVLLTTNYPEHVMEIEKKRRTLVPTKLTIFETISALLSSAILVGAFYFLNKLENYIYSLIFLGLFLAFQIVEKDILYKQVYNFDKTYLPQYFDNPKNCKQSAYEKYVDYKRSFFTFRRGSLSSFLTAAMITFLLCLNDFRNSFILLSLVIIKLIEKLLFSNKEEDSKHIIAEYENKAFENETITKNCLLNANLIANKHIFYNSVKEILYIFISFVFALLMMFITKNTGCNYVIFHFVMYFAGFNSYNQLIESLSNRKDIKRKEARFYDSCNL